MAWVAAVVKVPLAEDKGSYDELTDQRTDNQKQEER